MKKIFNGVIVGTGASRPDYLASDSGSILYFDNHDVKTSELHGLSQKGGPLRFIFRFGKGIFSPLVKEGEWI